MKKLLIAITALCFATLSVGMDKKYDKKKEKNKSPKKIYQQVKQEKENLFDKKKELANQYKNLESKLNQDGKTKSVIEKAKSLFENFEKLLKKTKRLYFKTNKVLKRLEEEEKEEEETRKSFDKINIIIAKENFHSHQISNRCEKTLADYCLDCKKIIEKKTKQPSSQKTNLPDNKNIYNSTKKDSSEEIKNILNLSPFYGYINHIKNKMDGVSTTSRYKLHPKLTDN